ncbi:MAG TPA: GNAT family N-acetyltransferase [Bacteriovoracaceae bacterium]|nr:GNAT family N-acetyltransferase [Bacteriovoracaceae bacterium]
MKTIRIDIPSEDYDSVLSIRREVFIAEQNVPEDVEIDETEMDSTYFLTFLNDVPAATGRLRVVGQKIKFERIATLKKFRGQGAARDLMNTMFQYAKENYSTLIPYMHSQADAVGFYEKLGWKKTGESFSEAGIPHHAMTRTF